jgi:hypothetical protein
MVITAVSKTAFPSSSLGVPASFGGQAKPLPAGRQGDWVRLCPSEAYERKRIPSASALPFSIEDWGI